MAVLDLVKDLIAFDTTSRDSNLALIDYAQALLEKSGARCRRTLDATGQKANLFATFGPDGNGVRGPALAGALCAGVAAWVSVRFLMRYFETNRLTPFAWYCLLAGFGALLAFVV